MDNICLLAPRDNLADASKHGCTLACMTYRISESGRLMRTGVFPHTSGGLMYIDNESNNVLPCRWLTGDIVRECSARRFSGVALDLSPELSPEIAADIASVCSGKGLRVYVPPHLSMCRNSVVMISTGITAGSLSGRLRSAIDQYGTGRVAMAIDFLRAKYTLPARDGKGTELSREQIQVLKTRYRSASFFSKDLCTFYFTYRTGNHAHLVLYDNAVSIRRKLSLGKGLGIGTAFMFYPHVKDCLEQILEK